MGRRTSREDTSTSSWVSLDSLPARCSSRAVASFSTIAASILAVASVLLSSSPCSFRTCSMRMRRSSVAASQSLPASILHASRSPDAALFRSSSSYTQPREIESGRRVDQNLRGDPECLIRQHSYCVKNTLVCCGRSSHLELLGTLHQRSHAPPGVRFGVGGGCERLGPLHERSLYTARHRSAHMRAAECRVRVWDDNNQGWRWSQSRTCRSPISCDWISSFALVSSPDARCDCSSCMSRNSSCWDSASLSSHPCQSPTHALAVSLTSGSSAEEREFARKGASLICQRT